MSKNDSHEQRKVLGVKINRRLLLGGSCAASLVISARSNAQFIAGGDPRLVTPSSRSFRQATNRCRISTNTSNGFTSGMASTWQVSYVPISVIQLVYTNWYVNQSTGAESNPGAATTVAYSVEYPLGTFTQVTWNGGSPSASVANGATQLTDQTALGFTIPPFTWFRIRMYVANSTLMIYNGFSFARDAERGDQFQFNGSNLTMGGTITSSGADFTNMINPTAILASSTLRVWGLFGDSITAGVNDLIPDPSGGFGLFGRAVARNVPHVNFGCPGDRLSWFVGSNAKRIALAGTVGITDAIQAYGVNDFGNGVSSATMIADDTTFQGLLPNLPIWRATVTPQTSSSDNFETATNQTVTSSGGNTQRIAFNTNLRAGTAAGWSGIIDTAQLLETATTDNVGPVLNGGVWIPGYTNTGATFGDGVHTSTRGIMACDPMVQAVILVQGNQQNGTQP